MQQVSHIAGIHAVMTLGELIKNQFGEASRWDLANGWNNGNDHGLFNIGDEPGSDKWNPRPAYYHMYFFQKYFGDKMVPSSSSDADIVSYASIYSGTGEAGVVLVNRSSLEKSATVKITNFRPASQYYWHVLTGGTDNGAFSRKVYVNGIGPAGGSGGPNDLSSIKANAASTINGITLVLPPMSVVFMAVESKK
jgi:hypothetical protein